MVHVAHESDYRSTQLQLFLLYLLRFRRLFNDLLNLVNSPALFAFLFLENETVLLTNRRRDIGLDGLIRIRKDVQCLRWQKISVKLLG